MPFLAIDWLGLMGFFGVGYLPAVVNAMGAKAPTVYSRLKMKGMRIPTWIYSLIWMVLYCLLSAGAFLFWQTGNTSPNPSSTYHAGLAVFIVHQVLNAVWSPLLFGQGWLAVALADAILCFLFSIAMCGLFFTESTAAGVLILPLILWYLFAVSLNIYIVWNNGPKVDAPSQDMMYDKLNDD